MANESDAPHPSIDKYARHVNPAFVKLLGVFGYGRVFVRARDCVLVDHQGREYLDFLAGFGSLNLGHNHPRVVERLREFLLEGAPSIMHVGPSVHAAELAEQLALVAGAPLQVTLFSSSGAEAVEAGMKLARAATGRRYFLSCKGGYHGLSFGTLSIAGDPRMKKSFPPLMQECDEIPFGELDALEKEMAARKYAAFIVEPIQGEGGVNLAPPGYLRRAQEICRRQGALMILDEVQTGMGRTGKTFAFEHEGFVPDVLVLAKALGAGMLPIGATLTTKELHGKAYGSMDKFDLHGATFAGNALSCVAALAGLQVLTEERLADNAAARGEQLLTGLKKRLDGHPLVRDVRGRGLLVAIELGGMQEKGFLGRIASSLTDVVSKKVFGQWLALRLLEEGILCQPASQQWNVLKLEPPLTVTAAQVDRVVHSIASILERYRELGPLMKDVAERMGKQFLAGNPFG